MIALFCLCLALFVSPLKSKSRLEAKNAALRHQLIMLRRKVRGRVRLTDGDRFLHPAVSMVSDHPQCHYNCSPRDPRAMAPSRLPPVLALEIPLPWGRPQIDAELRALIRRMSADNPLWGAPRIHGELLKLGFVVAQSSVAKYMVKRCGPAVPGMAHLPAQPRAGHRRHGPVTLWRERNWDPTFSRCSCAIK
jgi:hypothetical protein